MHHVCAGSRHYISSPSPLVPTTATVLAISRRESQQSRQFKTITMRGLRDRIILTIVNLLFPPAAVYALCGIGLDLALNCVFFILAVIPSHIHGFYITCTYFHRRRKVRKAVFQRLVS